MKNELNKVDKWMCCMGLITPNKIINQAVEISMADDFSQSSHWA